ncbi:MAG: histidine phosphatase family protein [Lachnospiraceae bacterium]|nr:histidine phosphatase family protein [Lachnospiraceae bacterium]
MAHKTVCLIRHAKTAANLEKRYIGKRTDAEPAEEYLPEAEEAAAKLFAELNGSGTEMLRLCSGPMKRAVRTAEVFSRIGKLPPAAVMGDLTEIDFGEFEGKNYADLQDDPRYQAWIDSGGAMTFPGGESRQEFTERSWRGFTKALGDPALSETVVIVCHGGNIMAILSRLSGEDYYSFMAGHLEGYRLELEMDDEGIASHTFCRIVRGVNT